MATRPKKSSPILGASASVIEDASERLIPEMSSFSHTFEVDVGAVGPDPAQARRNFDEKSLAALAATLEAEGQLQPVLLRRNPDKRNHWIIVAGERRWRAAKLLQWPKLLAIAHAGDAEVAGLVENLQRVDLSPFEEARGISRLIAEKGWTQDQAAHVLGKPKSDVSGTLRILSLPKDVLHEVLTSEHALAKNVLVEMARITDQGILRQLVEQARGGTLTVKTVRALRGRPAATPPASRAEHSRRPGHPWRVIRKAEEMVSKLAISGAIVSPSEAASLQELRSAIDRLLATSHPGLAREHVGD